MKKAFIFVLALFNVLSLQVFACSPLTTPSLVTYAVSGNNLLINWESTNVWACDGYSIEVEVVCQNNSFTGIGPFYNSAVLSKTVVTSMAYPQQTINLASFCPGQVYLFRAREALGSLPSQWTSVYTFTTPGTPVPTVLSATASSTTVCSTGPAQLSASISGCGINNAVFNWQPAAGLSCSTCSNPVASPTVATTYTCIAGQLACNNSASTTIQILVSSSTFSGTVVSTPTVVCAGANVQLSLQNAPPFSYEWESAPASSGSWTNTGLSSTPVATLTPSAATNCYRVRAPGCESYFTTNTICIAVNPVPTLAISGPSVVCEGETFTLTASGADTYSWNGNQSGSELVTQQSTTGVYTLVGYATNNCSTVISHTVTLMECENPGTGTSVSPEQMNLKESVTIFPNPNEGNFTVHCACTEVRLYDAVGKQLTSVSVTDERANLSNLKPGIYFVAIPQNKRWYRIVVTPR